MIRDMLFNQPLDTYLITLITAILLFVWTLDCLIESIREEKKERRKKWRTTRG